MADTHYVTFPCEGGHDCKPVFIGHGSAGQILVAHATSLGVLFWANTLGGSAGEVYAATGNTYVVLDLAPDLTNEFRLVQSGNSVTISTADNLIIINAVTNAGGSSTSFATSVQFMSQTSAVWTNMPAAHTEFMGNFQFRNIYDVTGITSVNLGTTVTTIGSAVAHLVLKWTTDNGTTFDYMGNVGSSPSTNIGSTGMRTSGWVRTSTAAVGTVILAVFGSCGDGAIDPRFANVSALFR